MDSRAPRARPRRSLRPAARRRHGDDLYDVVAASGARSIAVIGLVKNAGKTTVVNALMDNVPLRFGLTSLGLDGERTDHLTGPRQAAHRAAARARSSPPPSARSTARTTRWSSSNGCRSTRRSAASSSARAGGDGRSRSAARRRSREVAATVDRLHALGAEHGARRRRHQPPGQRLAARQRRA